MQVKNNVKNNTGKLRKVTSHVKFPPPSPHLSLQLKGPNVFTGASHYVLGWHDTPTSSLSAKTDQACWPSRERPERKNEGQSGPWSVCLVILSLVYT